MEEIAITYNIILKNRKQIYQIDILQNTLHNCWFGINPIFIQGKVSNLFKFKIFIYFTKFIYL